MYVWGKMGQFKIFSLILKKIDGTMENNGWSAFCAQFMYIKVAPVFAFSTKNDNFKTFAFIAKLTF